MVRITALAGIFAISFSAVFVRLADVSPVTAAFFRVAYAIPILYVASRLFPGERTRRERAIAASAGIVFAVDLSLWFICIDAIGAGLATMMASSQVLWVGLLAWWLLGERPRPASFVVVPVAMSGIVLIGGLGRADAYGSDPLLGVLTGIGAGLTYGLFIFTFRHANRRQAPPAGPLLDVSVGAAIGLLVISPFDSGFSLAVAWPAHGWLLAQAVMAQSVGWMAISAALPRLPALETSIMLLLQPAASVLWAQLVFAEALSPVQWAGAAAVFLAVLIAALSSATGRRHTVLEPLET